MQDRGEGNHDPGNEDDRDGIRERPGDLKDDGSTRERRQDKAWKPGDDENDQGSDGERKNPSAPDD